MKTLQFLTFGALLCVSAVAHAEGPETREYSRKGELSPGAEAPTLSTMVDVIQRGSPEKLKATLEYGERVVCEACVPLLEGKLLESGNARVREMSAWWLRRQPFAAPMLLVKLRSLVKTDASAERRARAAEALGEFMDPHALPELSDAALQDPEPSVRVAAVRALARLNHEVGGAVLADVLKDQDRLVKLAALDVLVVVTSFRDYDALLPLLGDSDADVRARAARLCGEYRVREAETVLAAMLEGDQASSARKAAAWALGRIGGSAGQEALTQAQEHESDDRVLDAIRVAQRMPVRF